MISLKMTIRATRIVAFALSVLIFCFTTPVMAAPSPFAALIITQKAQITGGKFTVNRTTEPLPARTVIRSAKLSLPSGETGTINKIQITGPNGLEFGCQNIKVKDGINLIKACGGPAVLEAGGPINYVAEGSSFGPELNTELQVVLSDEF